MSVYQGTLVDRAWPTAGTAADAVRAVALIIFGSLLMTVGAKIEVPFFPVPMTMQTFALVLLIGCYGGRLAAASVGLYLVQGLAGMPVFAAPVAAGLVYFQGPTGGYLIGFLVAAAVGGWLVDRSKGAGVIRMAAILTLSIAIVFVCGLAWLSTLVGFSNAIQFGFVPFVLGDIVKIALATAVIAGASQMVKPS
ncbi:MAG: biotin transporter BioY [Pseudomonadota bacterium]